MITGLRGERVSRAKWLAGHQAIAEPAVDLLQSGGVGGIAGRGQDASGQRALVQDELQGGVPLTGPIGTAQQAGGHGAVAVDGKMVDAPVLRRAHTVLERSVRV